MTITVSYPAPLVQSEPVLMELVFADGTSHLIDRDALRLGAGEICEVRLPQGPRLHSVIHSEAGVVWIEADSAELVINGRSCRRMALREGDVINAGGIEMTLRYRASLTPDETGEMADLQQMSAEQLCDRIVEEQAEVDAYESAQRQGWQNLMVALRALKESHPSLAGQTATTEDNHLTEECQRLLDQIHEMSLIMNGKALELDDCEAELVAATALLQETQDRISHQIEELFEQFSDLPVPNELRASA